MRWSLCSLEVTKLWKHFCLNRGRIFCDDSRTYVFKLDDVTPRGPTTFDLRVILQKCDNLRATFKKMIYKTTNLQDLKLKRYDKWVRHLNHDTLANAVAVFDLWRSYSRNSCVD